MCTVKSFSEGSVLNRVNSAATIVCIVLSAERRSISESTKEIKWMISSCLKSNSVHPPKSLTAQSHLTAHAQPGFHHLTHAFITQNGSQGTCQAVSQDVQDLEQNYLIRY